MTSAPHSMNEFELIDFLTRSLPSAPNVVAGVGEDCAVLDIGLSGEWVLFKTDAVVEGIHFTAETPPEQIGRKALARCLSDIAAMAGKPSHALVTLAVSRQFDPARLEAVYRGMRALAGQHGVTIVGGETTSNPERLLISVALIGAVSKEHCPLRSGAKPGDAIFVTGELGGSLSGRHLDFEPRIREAQWLARHFSIHSMMDISDGLAGDLRHILKAGGVGAELLAAAIPVSRAAKLAAREKPSAKPALLAALTDGEDFELLFTVASRSAVPLLDAWKKEFPEVRLSCVGKITREPGLRLRDEKGVRELHAKGYVHLNGQ